MCLHSTLVSSLPNFANVCLYPVTQRLGEIEIQRAAAFRRAAGVLQLRWRCSVCGHTGVCGLLFHCVGGGRGNASSNFLCGCDQCCCLSNQCLVTCPSLSIVPQGQLSKKNQFLWWQVLQRPRVRGCRPQKPPWQCCKFGGVSSNPELAGVLWNFWHHGCLVGLDAGPVTVTYLSSVNHPLLPGKSPELYQTVCLFAHSWILDHSRLSINHHSFAKNQSHLSICVNYGMEDQFGQNFGESF